MDKDFHFRGNSYLEDLCPEAYPKGVDIELLEFDVSWKEHSPPLDFWRRITRVLAGQVFFVQFLEIFGKIVGAFQNPGR